jgi:crotonobetainyl-CoA:carnitine CoA-transferase CaiB-like acyl-CoA transferase
MTRANAAARCEQAGLPFAPIQRPEDLFEDPHLAVPGAMTPLTLANGTKLPLPALPIEIDGERLEARLDLPQAGEHSTSIAASLGYSAEDIRQLIERGIISTTDTRVPA